MFRYLKKILSFLKFTFYCMINYVHTGSINFRCNLKLYNHYFKIIIFSAFNCVIFFFNVLIACVKMTRVVRIPSWLKPSEEQWTVAITILFFKVCYHNRVSHAGLVVARLLLGLMLKNKNVNIRSINSLFYLNESINLVGMFRW